MMIARALILVGLVTISSPAWAACTDLPAPGVVWTRCVLDGRDLRGAALPGGHLRDASAFRADFTGADLSGFDGERAKFIRAVLSDAKMGQARLAEADFTGAMLLRTDLAGADLRRARMNGADLTDADLTGARLDGADFNRARLSGAKWIDGRVCGAESVGQCR